MRHLAARRISHIAALAGVAALLAAGCKKADNSLNYRNALDSFYAAHPVCLWNEPIKFPVQEDTGDAGKTGPYDALVDQGMLVRTTAEKKKLIIASKQVNNYDLSDKGRSAWQADPSQPGYGNFCYSHRKVSAIDSSTPTNSQPGATTQVSYHYTMTDAPAWATAQETETAFPRIPASLNPGTDQETLTNTDHGWELIKPIVQPGTTPDSTTGNGSNDGKIVR